MEGFEPRSQRIGFIENVAEIFLDLLFPTPRYIAVIITLCYDGRDIIKGTIILAFGCFLCFPGSLFRKKYSE